MSFKVSTSRLELKTLQSNVVRTQNLSVRDETSVNNINATGDVTVNGSAVVSSGLRVGSTGPYVGTSIYSVSCGTLSVNPGNITAGSTVGVTVTLTGSYSSDRIFLQSPSTLNSGLVFVGCDITADNTLTVYLYNKSGSAIDDGASTWKYTWLHLD